MTRDDINLIYQKSFVRLCHYAGVILRDFTEAEDVVSEVFEKVLTGMAKSTVANAEELEKYLVTAVKNKCINITAKKERRQGFISEYTVEDELDLEFYYGLSDLKLLDTVYGVSTRGVEVIRKMYFEDKSHAEIAKEMGISKATVSNLQQQGMKCLKRKLNPQVTN